MVETNASSSATDEPAKSEDLPNDEGAIDGSIRVEGGNDEGNNVKRSNVESFKRMIKAAKKMSSRKKKREIRDADSEEEQNILEVEKKQNEEEGEANSKEDQELDGGLDEKGEKNPNGEGSKEDLSNENNPGKRKRKSKLKKKGDQKQIKEKSTHPAEDNILGDENLSDDSQSSGVARNEKVVHDDDDEDDHVGDGDDEDVDAKQKRERKKNKNKGKLRHTKDKSADQGGQKKKLKSSTKKSKFIDSVAEEGEEETESESDSEETGNLSTLSLLDDEGNYNDNEDIVDSDEGLQYCENVLNQMILMHEQDIKNIKEKKPATAKLQIIDQVCMILTKPKWKPFFMKLNIYHVLALWLMPLSKNTLPNFTIRTNLLKVIQQLPITIKSLRGSQLGKIMTYLHTHKDETDENKKLIRTILQNWMGPIIGINTNYKQFLKERQKRILENPEYHKKVLEKAKTLLPDSISIEKEEEQNEMKKHATIPFNSECSFLINVPSSVPNSSKKIMPKSKIKRLTDNMKLLKRARKSQKVSIEGKGVAL
ncbi:putative IWS1-like protein [Plasmodium knowlesi]|uniref:Putative IWS1-like protein n=1 Tax=Plasmodium knowlesi TaxID=5850 RepID=A0A1Y3DJL0_PLAKN|nr:putative IWS1-like protein [Plasmodium knowlesi]